jgi:subtilisin family serine protease
MKSPKYWLAISLFLMIILVSHTSTAASDSAQSKIEPLVLSQLAETGQTEFFVWMAEKADLSPAALLPNKTEKGQFVFETLQETAERSQKELRAYLDAQGVSYKPFYIANKILVYSGGEALVLNLAARSDVAAITANHPFQLQEPFIDRNPPDNVAAIESNITFVKADDVWAIGYTGVGTVMAGNDTGLDWDHPALINQYRGWNGSSANHNYNWWDATGTYPLVPDDGHGHGTHTTGTMVGDDGATNQIGMAPGAETIHCKNMTDFGSGSDATFTECFQWDLAPWNLNGLNPDPSQAPDAINNSWGYFGGGQPQFEDEIAALQAAGIVVEVSAGNEGDGCATLRSPGDYLQVLTTGSIQHSTGVLPGTITGFSSRGPSALYPGQFFPDVMAPGENINSSLPGGGYSGPTWSGTSMAGPHVTGLIGLMWSASPALVGNVTETYDIIQDTAVRLTGQSGSNCGGNYTSGPNNDWGFGTIDALAAVNEAILRGGPNFTLDATPETLSICTPNNAVYTVNLGQILGYNSPVNLSVSGQPSGTTATFNPAAPTPPASSTLTIGNTGGATVGSYTLTITGVGTDPEQKTHSDTVVLDVFTGTPGNLTLSSPSNGATGVALAPTFSWTAAAQADTYSLQVATDSGFSNVVYSASVEETSHTTATNLQSATLYFWRVRAQNPCGMGNFSAVFSFTTRAIPPILLVDDDDNFPDVRAYYTDALNALQLSYDIWDTGNSDNEPTAVQLSPYRSVIWFTGVEFGGTAGPGSAGEAALAAFLTSGGQTHCFFISSQDYLFDRGLTAFLSTYLGVASYFNDVGQTTVTGKAIYRGLGPYILSYPFTNFSDIVNPANGAKVAFTGEQGTAALTKRTNLYNTVFLAFPLEAIPVATGRQEVLSRSMERCTP